MKRILIFILLIATSFSLSGQDKKVRFMPQWFAQAQFAGYYVAKEKGFYAAEGLDVEILHMSSTTTNNVLDYVEEGAVDIFTNELISSMIADAKVGNLVNILQTGQESGIMCVSRIPINSFVDLQGKRVGRWKTGFAEIAEFFCKDFNIEVDWVNSIQANNLFLANAIDAMLCYSYSEYISLLFAKGRIPNEYQIRFSDLGYSFPGDGLYTTKQYLESNPDVVDKFIKATKKGWSYAVANREETLDIVMKFIRENNIITNRPMQQKMLEEVLKLQTSADSKKIEYRRIDKDTFYMLNDYLMQLGYIESPVDYNTFVR